jgi:Actin like proteins N terminal domain
MTDIVTIAVDTGASGTKVVAAIGKQPCVAVLIEPHCMLTNDLNLLVKNSEFDEHKVWVKIGDEAYAVGTLAETQGASLKLKPAKYITAAPKICAAIGVVMQRLKLPSQFDLNLVCVLPASEYEDHKVMTDKVSSAIKTLTLPSGKVKIKLKNIKIFPEGYGLLQGQKGKPREYDSMTMVMMGHRNVSTFETLRGTLCQPHTSNYGFNHFLTDVASQTGYDKEELLKPILEQNRKSIYYSSIALLIKQIDETESKIAKLEKDPVYSREYNEVMRDADIRLLKVEIEKFKTELEKDKESSQDCDRKYNERFYRIIKSKGKDRDYENTKIQQAVVKATQKYVTKTTEWLDECMPNRTNIICVGGGTVNVFWDDIQPFLAGRIVGSSELGVLKHIAIAYPDHDAAKPMRESGRFADIYSLFIHAVG